MNNKKKCFVIMPVSSTKSCTEDEWKAIFEHIVKPAITGSRLGYDCEQAKPFTGAFIKDILEGLNRADVVIADLTDRNPNVCYELGIRHTLKKRTILIAQNMDDVPSDLQSYWVVTYEKDLTGAAKFKLRVREILREMQKKPDKSDSPVADFLGIKNIDLLAYEKKANLKRLNALISEMSRNLEVIEPVLTTCQENQNARKSKKQTSIVNVHFENYSLEWLIQSWYIVLPDELLSSLSKFNRLIITENNRLDAWSQERFQDSIEKILIESLPLVKEAFKTFMKDINKVRIDYINNNYQEPETPVILLASPEHKEYLKLTE